MDELQQIVAFVGVVKRPFWVPILCNHISVSVRKEGDKRHYRTKQRKQHKTITAQLSISHWRPKNSTYTIGTMSAQETDL